MPLNQHYKNSQPQDTGSKLRSIPQEHQSDGTARKGRAMQSNNLMAVNLEDLQLRHFMIAEF